LSFDELLEEMERLELGVRHTDDLEGVIVSPKERLTTEIREAIREHRRRLAVHVLWAGYCAEWVGASDPEAYPPWSPEMKEAYEEGDPQGFHRALEFYDQVREHWPLLEAILSAPGAALVAPKRGGGLITVLPEDDSVPSKRLPRRERRHKSRRKKGRKR
jgi:hypothetical protein